MHKLSVASRAFKSYISFKLGKPKLTSVTFYITTRCNLRCVFCDRWRNKPVEINTKEALNIVDQLCDFGVTYINYSGGEPLLRKDLEEVAKSSSDYGCINTINTNGTLIDEKRAKSISKVFDIITVSLDGFKKLHDGTRGIPGTYDKVMRALKALKKVEGAKVGVATTIYSANWDQVINLFEYLKDFVDFVSFQPVGGSFFRPFPPPKAFSIPMEKVDEFVDKLMEFKRKNENYLINPYWFIDGLRDYFKFRLRERLCDAGELYAGVNWLGNLLLCPIRDDTVIGNLLKTPLRDLWKMRKETSAWKKIKTCPGCWSQCTTMVSKSFRKNIIKLIKDIAPAYKLVMTA